ncbi:MAG: DUF6452 family protein [Flavobacteriaceae bacterium]|nr:DUF6452 family protein [Flavobacteriaceae bacterium]
MKKVVFLLLGIASFNLACTRDDICTPETSKTPLLIIKFFNAENPEAPKSVNAFTVFRPQDEFSLFAPITADSIALPLDTNADLTEYFFVSNANDSLPLADFISFTYNRKDEFINRACAFRTNFTNLDFTLENPTQQSWIDEIIIRTDSVNARNQNEAHLSIFH